MILLQNKSEYLKNPFTQSFDNLTYSQTPRYCADWFIIPIVEIIFKTALLLQFIIGITAVSTEAIENLINAIKAF